MTLAGWKETTGLNGEAPARAITQFTVISALRFGNALAIQDLFLNLRTVLLPLARGIPESREASEVITTFLDDFFLQLPAVNPTVPDVTSYVVAGFRNHLRNVVRDETTRHSAYERAASESRSTSENLIAECHSAYSIASANGHLSNDAPPSELASKLAHHLGAGLAREEQILLGALSEAVPISEIADWLSISYTACRVRVHRLRLRLHREAVTYAESLSEVERRQLSRILD